MAIEVIPTKATQRILQREEIHEQVRTGVNRWTTLITVTATEPKRPGDSRHRY